MLSILLVEDDAPLRRAFGRQLAREGYRVVAVDSAELGLAELEAGRFDLVLTDLHLGSGSGLDVVAAAQGKGTPVILMSAALHRAPEAKRPPFTLAKPFDPAELLATIVKATSK